MSSTVPIDDELDLPGPLLPPAHTAHVATYSYSRARSILMVAIASLTLFLDNGFMLIGVTSFDPVMLTRLHCSVGALKVGSTITFMTVAAAAPLAGYLIDKWGPRPLFMIGMAIMAAGMFLYSIATSLLLVYVIYAMFGICLVLCGAFACLIVVSDASAKRRGMCIGILLGSSSVGGAISPAIFSALTARFSGEVALNTVAIAALCTIPLMAFLVPGKLRMMALPAPAGGVRATLGSSLRSRNFWLLATVAAIGYFGSIGGSANMILYLVRDLHLPQHNVNMVMLVLFAAILASQLLSGAICDIVNRRVLHVACILAFATGYMLLGIEIHSALWIAIVLYGLGWGCNYVLLQYLLTHLFSGPSVGRIIGVIGMIEALGGSLGPVAVGFSYNHAGSYGPAFLSVSCALFLTAIAAAMIQPPAVIHA